MIKLLSFILVLISSATFLHSQETEVITFADKFSEASARGLVFSEIVPKENRVKSSATTICRTFSEGMPDSISRCIDVAADIWESRLQCQTPIRLDFDYGDMFDSNYDTCRNNIDAVIHINKNTKWDCGYSSVTNDKKNLTYAMLRAITISLGFGSSVTKKNISGTEIITFTQHSGHSAFDNLIFSDSGKFLKDIPNLNKASNKELVDFVQSENGNLYVCDKISTNKLYAPHTFETYKSLIYLDSPQSLMHYDISVGDKRLNIYDNTINLLREIGWKIRDKKDVEIKCDENNESGILSAYSHHRFYVNREDITSPKWKLVLPLKNGSDYIVCQSENFVEFTSPAIDSISNYKLNINGDIYGRITFEGCINGTKVSDTYRVSFEAKPQIASVKIKGKSLNIATNSYDLFGSVTCRVGKYCFLS